jgi:hypothetical protein
MKGPNETISILNFYLSNKFNQNVKKICIFSDKCFAQMKSRYLWLFYDILVKNEVFEKINLIYPISGHSYLDKAASIKYVRIGWGGGSRN